MKWKLLFLILVIIGGIFYISHYHKDKYDSAISLVIGRSQKLTSQFHQTTDYVTEATEGITDFYREAGVLQETTVTSQHEANSVSFSPQEEVSPVKKVVNNGSYQHTDQSELEVQVRVGCGEIIRKHLPMSRYGRDIQNIALSYFTKIEKRYKFLYCSIPKVASTNFKRTMVVLSYPDSKFKTLTIKDVNGLKNVHNNPAIIALSKLNGSPLYPPYKFYYKFAFFRHPFTRMVSAWRNKFQINNGRINRYFYTNFGNKMIAITRGNKGLKKFLYQQKPLLSFHEFVVGIKNRIIDRHWMPQTEICRPCEVNYNFVGFFEHLDADVEYVYNEIGITDKIIQPDRTSEGAHHQSTTELTIELFNTLSNEEIDDLYKFYERDFLAFGYVKDVNDPSFPYPNIKLTST